MAAPALDNVISFPGGGRAPATPADRVLAECRDLAARRLREALRAMLEKVREELLERGDVADDRDQRNFFYRLKDEVTDKGGRLEAQLAAHWARQFDAATKGGPAVRANEFRAEEMQLVDHGELDEDLALKVVARRLHDKCEDELYAVGRRLGLLIGKEHPADEDNPAAPEVFTQALQGALRDCDFDTPSRVELCRRLDGHIADHVGPIYHALNANLVRHNILPTLRRGYGRSGSRRGKDEAATAGDIFALLQRLVSGPGGTVPGAGGLAVGGFPGGGGAMPGGVGAAAGGALLAQIASGATLPPGAMAAMAGAGPAEQVWSSLDTLQRAVPVFVAGQALPTDSVNVLREFRSSDVGQGLGQLDAITVDIVAMLFDMIFDDREIADPIKALVGRLQIPVLKVAMLDKSFFSSKAHPTRRLLDTISRAALRWGKQIGRDDPIYRKIAEVIDRIHAEFKQDTALFDAICADLDRFLEEQERAADAQAARAAPLVVRREQQELAAMAADTQLRPSLDGTLPRVVADLLDHEWRALLRRTYLEEGPESEAWAAAVTAANDLADSVRPRPDVQDRRALARQLPFLVKQLSLGLERMGVDGDRRHALFDALFSLHAAVLRGAEPPASAAVADEPAAPVEHHEPTLANEEMAEGDVTVETISLTTLPTAAVASEDIEDLQRGDWVEYIQADGSAVRYRLSWISPQRGIFLFTNPQSPRALAVSPEALSLQLQRGEVRIVPIEPIFDRAVTRAIDALQAAA